MTANHNTG